MGRASEIVTCAVALYAGAVAAADRKPLNVADVVSMRRIVGVAISGDGSRVAFAVEEPNDTLHSKDPVRSTLWTWSQQSGTVSKYPAPAARNHTPKWSPDGNRLAFLSSVPGQDSQLWIDQRAVLSGAGGYAWSPDGKSIAYLKPAPQSEEDRRNRELGKDEIHVRPGGPDQPSRPSQLRVLEIAGGADRQINIDGQLILAYDWAPDGSGLLVTTADSSDLEQLQHKLSVVPAAGGVPRQYCAAGGKAMAATWSPDGKSIAFLGNTAGASDAFPGALYICDGPGSKPKNLIADASFTVESFRWQPDGKSFVVVIAEGAHRALARLFRDGRVQRLTSPPVEVAFRAPYSVSKDGSRIACVLTTSSQPPDVWLVDADGSRKRVSELNPQLADRAYGESEEFRWRASDGVEIAGVLIRPVGYRPNTRYPLVAQVHGSQVADTTEFQGSWMNWGQLLAGRGCAVLLPNYRGSLTGGARFARADQGDLGGRDLKDIMEGIEALVPRGVADPDRLGIGGVSYGGFLSALAIARDTRFKAAVMGIGISNWISMAGQTPGPLGMVAFYWLHSPYERTELFWDHSPLAHASKIKTPTLIYNGENDPLVPVSQGRELFRALRHFGVPTEFLIYPREGHSVLEPNHLTQNLDAILGWFDRYLKH